MASPQTGGEMSEANATAARHVGGARGSARTRSTHKTTVPIHRKNDQAHARTSECTENEPTRERPD